MWKYGFQTLFLLFCLCLSATEKKDFEKAEREQCPSYYKLPIGKKNGSGLSLLSVLWNFPCRITMLIAKK